MNTQLGVPEKAGLALGLILGTLFWRSLFIFLISGVLYYAWKWCIAGPLQQSVLPFWPIFGVLFIAYWLIFFIKRAMRS